MNERDSEAHLALYDIWKIIEMLDSAIPVSQRPNQVEILRSLGDQRKPIAGSVAKDPLECRIASVSCQHLEELYL